MTPFAHADARDSEHHHAEIVLFHPVLGLNDGVKLFAERLRSAGHIVHTPDLYDGEVFDDVRAGRKHIDHMGGFRTLMERTRESVVGLPPQLVYAGFSNGAGSAELLAATRAGALGAVLMHGAMPLDLLGLKSWPANVPVQLHYAEQDPTKNQSSVDAFVRSVQQAGADFESYEYPVSGHLFADRSRPEYDARSADLMLERVLRFVARVGAVAHA